MANYLYQTIIYKITENVVGIDITQNNLNKTDFETNHKNNAIKVDNLEVAETTFEIYKNYNQFESLITGDMNWADAKYIETNQRYEIYLLSENPL